MPAKLQLSDSEFRERAQAGARLRAQRRRERLEQSGKTQIAAWIETTDRAQIEALAAKLGEPLNTTTRRIIQAGIQALATPESIP